MKSNFFRFLFLLGSLISGAAQAITIVNNCSEPIKAAGAIWWGFDSLRSSHGEVGWGWDIIPPGGEKWFGYPHGNGPANGTIYLNIRSVNNDPLYEADPSLTRLAQGICINDNGGYNEIPFQTCGPGTSKIREDWFTGGLFSDVFRVNSCPQSQPPQPPPPPAQPSAPAWITNVSKYTVFFQSICPSMSSWAQNTILFNQQQPHTCPNGELVKVTFKSSWLSGCPQQDKVYDLPPGPYHFGNTPCGIDLFSGVPAPQGPKPDPNSSPSSRCHMNVFQFMCKIDEAAGFCVWDGINSRCLPKT